MSTRIRNFTVVEVLIAAAIMAIILASVARFTAMETKTTERTTDRIFALQKAIQILNEVKTFLETSGEDAEILDSLNDGANNTSKFLTIQDISTPDDPISENVKVRPGTTDTSWRYSRRITVAMFGNSNSKDVRQVKVQIFKTSDTNTDTYELAEIWAVLRTSAVSNFPATQVYDVYCIAIENVPGWWVYMNNLIPQAQNAINDVQSRVPGLELRTHWITKMGYGRDRFYAPYINIENESRNSIPNPYFYPAVMPAGSATAEYYVPSLMRGLMRSDLSADALYPNRPYLNTYNDNLDPPPGQRYDEYNPYNKYPYSLADTYNNCMRYHDAIQFWEKRNEDMQVKWRYNHPDTNEAPPNNELTYRLLLDDLYLHPEKYKNALFINLHGELIPTPPIRNFSDPAFCPPRSAEADSEIKENHSSGTLDLSGVRVVTHPENMRFDDNESPRLRVYSFLQDPGTSYAAGDRLDDINEGPISVLIKLGRSTHIRGELNTEFLAWEAFSNEYINRMKLSDFITTYEGGVNNTAGNYVSYAKKTIPAPFCFDTYDKIITTDDNKMKVFNGTGWVSEMQYVNSADVASLPAEPSDNKEFGIVGTMANGDTGDVYMWNGSAWVDTGKDYEAMQGFQCPNWTGDFSIITDDSNKLCVNTLGPTRPVPTGNGLSYDYAYDEVADETSLPPTPQNNKFFARAMDNGTVYRWNGTAWEPVGVSLNDSADLPDYTAMWAEVQKVFVVSESDNTGDKITGQHCILIKLHNSPLRAPYKTGEGGLSSSYRMYGLEYIPCPVQNEFDPADNDYTLVDSNSSHYKNTARWVISLPSLNVMKNIRATTLSVQQQGEITDATLEGSASAGGIMLPLSIQTLVGNLNYKENVGLGDCSTNIVATDDTPFFAATDFSKGDIIDKGIESIVNWYEWSARTTNNSHTQTWITDCDTNNDGVKDITLHDAPLIPFSEKYQTVGDARHCPYLDVKAENGFNWYFSGEDKSSGGFTGYGVCTDSWEGKIEVDMPKYFLWIREGLMSCNGLWTTINGYSYYYIGTGNEIGYDSANGFPDSIPLDGSPFGTSDGTEQSICDSGAGGSLRGDGTKVIRKGGWIGRYWIGDLFVDSDYENWVTTGNVSAPTYYRINRSDGANYNWSDDCAGRRGQTKGCCTFYNLSNDGGSTRFDHDSTGGTGSMTSTVQDELQTIFSFIMPNQVDSNRPFRLNDGASKPHEWGRAPFNSLRTRGSVFQTLYLHSGGNYTSGLMQVYNPSDTTRKAVFAVNGISMTQEIGSSFIARYSLIGLLYGFLRAGGDSIAPVEFPQLPHLRVVFPNDTTRIEDWDNINIKWKIDWNRWNGESYSDQGLDTYNQTNVAPSSNIFFKILYSDDGLETWKYIQDDETVAEGVCKDEDHSANEINGDTFISAEDMDTDGTNDTWIYTYNWDISNRTDFPEGVYYLRIEAYRKDASGNYLQTHYSYHQQRIFVERY